VRRTRPTTPVIAGLASAAVLGAVVLMVAGCGEHGSAATVRVGYLPNVAHAPALVAVHDGLFTRALRGRSRLETRTFNSGPEAVEAIFAGALDVAYLGPSPAINAFQKSHGQAVKVISGAASGGAFFVVQPEISNAADLVGATVTDPKLGGSQDVALRTWLAGQGLRTDTSGGGDVVIAPRENAAALAAFSAKSIAGAWVPEPWATRLVQEGGGRILVDEATLWPDHRYPTTVIVAATTFLRAHPSIVTALLSANVEAIESIARDPAAARASTNAEIKRVTGRRLSDAVISSAWNNLDFTSDPMPMSFQRAAGAAKAAGLLESTDLNGLFDLGPLNAVLGASHRTTEPAP